MNLFLYDKKYLILITLFICILSFAAPALAATTRLHIVKYANDGTTILSEKTLTWQEMESSLPVKGDGVTHYYHQGPVFVDDPDPVNRRTTSVESRMKTPMHFRKRTWVQSKALI